MWWKLGSLEGYGVKLMNAAWVVMMTHTAREIQVLHAV
jgi:hypothetical protein